MKNTEQVKVMNTIEYNEMARDARRVLEHEHEEMADRLQQVNNFLQLMEHADALASKVERQNEELAAKDTELDNLRQQLEEERERNQTLELQLTEFSKLSAGVAKKSSQDEVLKALRTFINISKRKTLSKRITVKMVIMEFANSIGLPFPEDMAASLDSLDDEAETTPLIHIEQAGDVIDKGGKKVVNNY